MSSAIKLRGVRNAVIANNRSSGFRTLLDAEDCENLTAFGNIAVMPPNDLRGLVASIRKKFGIPDELSDAHILDSLQTIAQKSQAERAATFGRSSLGKWLSAHGVDLVAAMAAIAALLLGKS